MKTSNFFPLIQVDNYSATPKYLQVCNSIISAVESGKLKKDEMLPSINEISYMLEISRDTSERAYRTLKNQKVIISVPGKGYYIGRSDLKKKIKIFLLFNKLSAHKKIIYDSLVSCLGEDVAIDFYIYNNDYALFKNLIINRKSDYTHYVIIPHFVEGGENAHEIINTLPKDKLILLDKKIPGVDGSFSAVYENFEKDIYNALTAAMASLEKYHTLKIIFPKKSYHSKEILNGFIRFCQQYAFNHSIVNDLINEPINKGEAFINLMEDDLVFLLERVISQEIAVGRDVGIISYNETPVKKLLLNGITTISTDFSAMGEIAAELIKTNRIEHREIPFYLTLRKSL